MIRLWRDTPPAAPAAAPTPPAGLFPSGRQALAAVLAAAGLGRAHRVAVPEWSSHCVLSAVGRYAMPLPLAEALSLPVPPAAVLAYAQWGWPFPDGVLERLGQIAPVLVLDLVDSAPALLPGFAPPQVAERIGLVLSLSKVLGLSGGGLGFLDGAPLGFAPDPAGEVLARRLWSGEPDPLMWEHFLHVHKSEAACLHPKLAAWLAANDLAAAAAAECTARRANLAVLNAGPGTADWPAWMRAALESGAAPGLVPLWLGRPAADLRRARAAAAEHGVEAEVYHFNRSGDPLSPDYAPCLAFPAHGLASAAADILPALARVLAAGQ